jgi:anti-sigma regulatory factor (Ser/Thr protein kinase)
MFHGQQSAPVQIRERRYDQDPSPFGLPERLLPGALPRNGLQPGTPLPAARWVCRQVVSSPVEAGLACRGAREFAGQTLGGWGLLALAEDTTVIVSELVTNALVHGCDLSAAMSGQVELFLWCQAGQMVCAVTDPGPAPPVLVSPDLLAEAGRGLQVVQALSATWGWTRLGGCRKAVWAALRVPGAEAAGEWRGPAAGSAIA